jgi:hypothetical protein
MRGNDLYNLYFTLPTDSPSTHQPHLVLSYPFRTLYCGTKFESSRTLYIGTEGVLHTRCHHEFPFLLWEHIWWKPASPCKLWKLQSKPHDLDPRENSWEVGGVICKIHGRWEGWFAKVVLQITPPTSSKRAVRSTSCDSDLSFHSFQGKVLISTWYVAFYFRQRWRAFCDNGSH